MKDPFSTKMIMSLMLLKTQYEMVSLQEVWFTQALTADCRESRKNMEASDTCLETEIGALGAGQMQKVGSPGWFLSCWH